ncbi:Capsid/spike protein, ssDNA virus,Capsid protein VP4 [Cinara cedri]|uniref:Capsid/spike protein, ssDNA virus,Capsid protein VP4 n=1 Tax=Cinara cedri TaxID=506608 RepID=A0A5E4NKH9_9HEMI|nr:Capsid/spike protein, ssDNA virus,Capsid protein VP4 [Cinara cedri]
MNIIKLIRGVRVISVKAKVCMRNPRTAFETNASTSNLATLNQNKFALLGYSVLNSTRCTNCTYEFGNATKPMVPNNVSTDVFSVFKKAISAMYGVHADNFSKPNFEDNSSLPCSYLNLPMHYPVYCTMHTNKKASSTLSDTITDGDIGWLLLNNFVTKVDASSLIGSTVTEYSYESPMGLLSCPWEGVFNGKVDNDLTAKLDCRLISMQGLSTLNTVNMNFYEGTNTHNVTANTYKQLRPSFWNSLYSGDDRYFNPTDCSQFITRGPNTPEHSYKVQLSLHVGVAAVPQLTTTSADLTPTNFTDVECTWDIQTEMVCTYDIPYQFTHFKNPHIHNEEAFYVHPHATISNVQEFTNSNYNNMYTSINESTPPA